MALISRMLSTVLAFTTAGVDIVFSPADVLCASLAPSPLLGIFAVGGIYVCTRMQFGLPGAMQGTVWVHEQKFFKQRGTKLKGESWFETTFPGFTEERFEHEKVCPLVDEKITFVRKDHPALYHIRNVQETGLLDHVDIDSPRYSYSTGWCKISTPFYQMLCEAVRLRYIEGYREWVYLGEAGGI